MLERSNFNREKVFGTDGIRGTPGTYPLTDGMMFKIATGIARLIWYKKDNGHRSKVVIGQDTRVSSKHIEGILSDTLSAHDIDVLLAGVITTPGLSFLVKDTGASMGVMISASHNKATDNGIKFFNSEGYKLSSEEEEWVEDIIFSSLIHKSGGIDKKRQGKVVVMEDAQDRYIDFLKSVVKGVDLSSLHLVIDYACGAGAAFGKKLFDQLGITVSAINDSPSGEHINLGGAMDPSRLKKVVLNKGANIGVGLDGDGDRSIVVDEQGNILDGDHLLTIIAQDRMRVEKLTKNTVVTTHMSNLGFKKAMKKMGVQVLYTNVGDKYVVKALLDHKLNVGGEQSGHIILLDYLPCPDGLLTGLVLCNIMQKVRQPLSKLSERMKKFPQILINIRVKEKIAFEDIESINQAIDDANAKLKDKGRLFLRYSGTEPLARIMVEAEDENLMNEVADDLASLIKQELGVQPDGVGV
ncbi:phosphoglucosamine mutase [Candidatus Omnitrophota bacterium]